MKSVPARHQTDNRSGISTRKIPPAVIAALKASDIDGASLTLTGKLDRATYVATNAVLEMLGGKWTKGAKAHVFPEDCEQTVALAIMTGEVMDFKKHFQIFETPDKVADQMVELANIVPPQRVLEPSAGRGSLIRAINRAMRPYKHQPRIYCCEMHRPNADYLQSNFMATFLGFDFMELSNEGGIVNLFDRIIMNPPFKNGQDIAHVQKAYTHLADGGRMVALTYPAWEYRTDKKHAEFREWLSGKITQVIKVPAGSFSSSGTEIETRMLVIDKPLCH